MPKRSRPGFPASASKRKKIETSSSEDDLSDLSADESASDSASESAEYSSDESEEYNERPMAAKSPRKTFSVNPAQPQLELLKAAKKPRVSGDTLHERDRKKSTTPTVQPAALKRAFHTDLTLLISIHRRTEARRLMAICRDEEVKALVNQPNKKGHTPLMVALAACAGDNGKHSKVIFDLLEHGVDLQQLSRSDFSEPEQMLTPMQVIENLANQQNNPVGFFSQMQRYCKDKPNIFDPHMNNSKVLSNELIERIKCGKTEEIKSLLQSLTAFSDPTGTVHSVNQPDGNGCTPLMHALELERSAAARTDIIKILLAFKASPIQQSTGRFSDHKSPLTRVRELLKASTNPAYIKQLQHYLMLFEQADICQLDPTLATVSNEDLSEVLLDLDAVPPVTTSKHPADASAEKSTFFPKVKKRLTAPETPLTAKVKKRLTKEVRILLENTTPELLEEFVNKKNGHGRTPLMIALESRGSSNIISLLLTHNADINQKSTGISFEGEKLPCEFLNQMIQTTTGKVKQHYINYKTVLDKRPGAHTIKQIITPTGRVRNPLTIAICKCDIDAVTACFEKLNSETEITPLMLANAPDSEGTPLMHALQNTKPRLYIIQKLLQEGADPHLTSVMKGSVDPITPFQYVNIKIEEFKGKTKEEIFLKCKACFLCPRYIQILPSGNNEFITAIISDKISAKARAAHITEFLSKFDPEQQKALLNLPNYRGRSPLMIAVESYQISPDVIETLIKYGADVNATSATRHSSDKKDLLDCIAKSGNREKKITDLINQARSALVTSTDEQSGDILIKTTSITPQFKNYGGKQPRTRVSPPIQKPTPKPKRKAGIKNRLN